MRGRFSGFEVREVLDGDEVEWTRRPSGAVDPLTAERSPDRKTVHFVLPLFNRLTTFDRFADNYEAVCLAADEDYARAYTLTVVPYGRTTVERAVAVAAGLTAKYPGARIDVLPSDEGSSGGGGFARARALHAGAARAGAGDLLFFVDVDMLWTAALVHRVRLNTVHGRAAYFPIVYSEFDPVVVYGRTAPSPNHFLVDQDTGYWRQYGFGVVSAYKSDLEAAGGFDTAIRGWGNEDVDLFDKFVRASRGGAAAVFRAADPDLVHVYHAVECDPGLPDAKARMCADTRFETYGNVDQFANIIYRNAADLYKFSAVRRVNGTWRSATALQQPIR